MTDEKKLQEDEDTEESRQSWLQHQHTRKRVIAQRKENERLMVHLHNKALGSSDADVRHIAVQLQGALAWLKVLEGEDT